MYSGFKDVFITIAQVEIKMLLNYGQKETVSRKLLPNYNQLKPYVCHPCHMKILHDNAIYNTASHNMLRSF